MLWCGDRGRHRVRAASSFEQASLNLVQGACTSGAGHRRPERGLCRWLLPTASASWHALSPAIARPSTARTSTSPGKIRHTKGCCATDGGGNRVQAAALPGWRAAAVAPQPPNPPHTADAPLRTRHAQEAAALVHKLGHLGRGQAAAGQEGNDGWVDVSCGRQAHQMEGSQQRGAKQASECGVESQGRHVFLTCEVQRRHPRIKPRQQTSRAHPRPSLTAACAHHEPLQRRQPHGSVDRGAARHRAHAAAGACIEEPREGGGRPGGPLLGSMPGTSVHN
jgi:hypothetical protein